MAHPNEDALRHLYGLFAQGDMAGFLNGCTDDVTFLVPGPNRFTGGEASRTFTKETFIQLVGVVMETSRGTFVEEIVDVFANDEHALVLLDHRFDRDGELIAYRTSHIVELRDGKIAQWREHPGSMTEFQHAWR